MGLLPKAYKLPYDVIQVTMESIRQGYSPKSKIIGITGNSIIFLSTVGNFIYLNFINY